MFYVFILLLGRFYIYAQDMACCTQTLAAGAYENFVDEALHKLTFRLIELAEANR